MRLREAVFHMKPMGTYSKWKESAIMYDRIPINYLIGLIRYEDDISWRV